MLNLRSRIAAQARFLLQDSNFVEKYSAKYLVTGLKMWAVGEEALGEHNPASEMHVQVNVSFRLLL